MSELAFVHVPGNRDASSHEWYWMLAANARGQCADVVTLTGALSHYATTRAWARLNGYHVVQSVKQREGDCAILVRKDFGYSYVDHTRKVGKSYSVKSCVVKADHTHLVWVTVADVPAHRLPLFAVSELKFGRQDPYVISAFVTPRSNLKVAEATVSLPATPGFPHHATRTVYRLGEK